MPSGGHKGGWWPTPRDIYRSRWKRFYKRTYRWRSALNHPDNPPPYRQAGQPHDFVPSPMKLQVQIRPTGGLPPWARRGTWGTYLRNSSRYMSPAQFAQDVTGRDYVMRCLDRGSHGGGDTGYGRIEAGISAQNRQHPQAQAQETAAMPEHIRRVLEESAGTVTGGHEFVKTLKDTYDDNDKFYVKRLAELTEEFELVWETRDGRRRRADGDHGIFPYVDEKASLVDDLRLDTILKLRHRTKRRRMPKWIEIQYVTKKWHQQYMRRRHMLKDEAAARHGIVRQAMQQNE
eukprot:NODE_11997_length_1252_cov_9.296889.p2 GENE.NODE_11997_length_1252_cov_9.296889~~NODE_11997_length_1252_cov_9.296889.p2  ORF type:complete len:289 (-),score=38.93 NODE_11997_length_1252_cov_9.296889:303-1169(-)